MSPRVKSLNILNQLTDSLFGRKRERSELVGKYIADSARAPSRPPVAARPVFESSAHPLLNGCPPEWASGWGDDRFGVWVEFTIARVTQRMRWIGPNRFKMGSPKTEAGHYDYDGPQHEVRMTKGFWLFDAPVTQALWTAVMGNNPSHFQGDERPVDSVGWEDAERFLKQMNTDVPGIDLVLPSEMQWEYACRAGTATPNYVGDSRVLKVIAWFDQNSDGKTQPVRKLAPNAWGLYDMLGNVLEWCADGPRSYEATAAIDPVGPLDGHQRAGRGGAWNCVSHDVRSAHRFADHRAYRGADVGFRGARVRE